VRHSEVPLIATPIRCTAAPQSLSPASGISRRDLFGEYLEAGELARAERGDDCNVGGVATACHQDPADAQLVVAGVEGVPAASEIDLEPCAKIHGSRAPFREQVIARHLRIMGKHRASPACIPCDTTTPDLLASLRPRLLRFDVQVPYDVERRSALVMRLFRVPVFNAAGEEALEEACAGMIADEGADNVGVRRTLERRIARWRAQRPQPGRDLPPGASARPDGSVGLFPPCARVILTACSVRVSPM
jgi:hypothetical protein